MDRRRDRSPVLRRARSSAAFFHDGNVDALIETLSTCIGDGSPYAPITVGEHINAKLAGSRAGIANRAAEREAARVLAATSGGSSAP